MRVALVVPSISRMGGGVSEAARLLAHALADRGDVTVEVITLKDRYFDEDLGGWGGIRVAGASFIGPSNYGFSPSLLWLLAKSRADVVHVHGLWMFHCLAVHLWALLTRKPYIVTTHGMLEAWIVARSSRMKRFVSRLYQDRFLKRASTLHALTVKEKGDLGPLAAFTTVTEIPNFAPQQVAQAGKPGWWTPAMEGKRIYLFLGRIHIKKGWDALLEGWEILCRVDPGFREGAVLVFCGWPDGSDDFQRRADELRRLYNNVIYVGPQYGEAKTRTLNAAHAFVLPSKSEGLPMVVLEAWSLGVPVLMTSACNLSVGFERGAALEIGQTASAVAEGLATSFLWTAPEREALVAAARALVRERYSQEVVTARMVALYADCTPPTSPPAPSQPSIAA